jgi:Arylsulfotransferase (ASST)
MTPPRFAVVLLAAALVAGCGDVSADRASAPVARHGLRVYPGPHTRTASPTTQITIRGATAASLGQISVRGSKTGYHGGRLASDSDGRGASFVPDAPFADGEVVSVRLGRAVVGTVGGVVHFHVAAPAKLDQPPQDASSRRFGVATFHSRPDLEPTAIKVRTRRGGAGDGDIFVAPKGGDSQPGPMILDAQGGLVWFAPMPGRLQATDFRVQRYEGKPVLTWWQGTQSSGHGLGEGVIVDANYRRIATVKAGNGYDADFHEFTLTDHGTALIDIYNPVHADLRSVGGPADGVVYDDVVQEIDIKTGLVLFEWHSLGHVPIADSYRRWKPGKPLEYFHINSVDEMPNGNLLISSRETWGVYDIDRASGRVAWRLGGKHSTFKMGPGTRFSWQHDARSHGRNEISVFDNHSVRPTPGAVTRGLVIRLDRRHRTARLVRAYSYPGGIQSPSQGNTQLLPGRGVFMGWGGGNANFSELSASGKLLFDARFASGANTSYRAYRHTWHGQPSDDPAAAVVGKTVYASWNGATEVASWRVLAGPSAGALAPGPTAPRAGFETAIPLGAAAGFVRVEALDASGSVLGRSPVVRAG